MTGCPPRHHAAIVRRHAVAGLTATASLIFTIGVACPLGAQVDTTVPALQLSVAAGPALDVRSGTGARVGYTLQGTVTLVRTPSPWRLRADVVYLHAETLGWDMHSSRDRLSDRDGEAVSSTAGFVSAVLSPRAARGMVPYAIGGIGLGWVNTMRGTAYTEQSRGSAGFAWQGGGGIEWARGRRAIGLEARLQSIRSAGANGWYTTLPVTVGVRF